jgi:hypothetical protein
MVDAVDAQFKIDGIVIIVGNYGSGKTEVAINLAVDQRFKGARVSVADLDLVNPYFRTREARKALAEIGVPVVLPPEGLLQADLPILTPAVAGLIRNPGDLAILDAGGDDVGATVLAALADAFEQYRGPVHMLQVVNPFRPNTDTVDGCLKIQAAIEGAAKMTVNGWIGNANMLTETTLDQINDGYRLMCELADRSGLPLMFITAAADLMEAMAVTVTEHPILPIYRQLVPPWLKPQQFPSDGER